MNGEENYDETKTRMKEEIEENDKNEERRERKQENQ